ncbi:MAG: UMP kinase [Candidatus Bathyarchaeia archaeon]
MKRVMRVVIRIGGSVIASPVNPNLIGSYVELLKKLKMQGHEVAVVVGGGAPAREFIAVAKSLGLNEKAQDEIAIAVSRIFAQLFKEKLDVLSCPSIPLTVEEAAKCFGEGHILVMGGLKPGMTTDAVAALIAEKVKAELLVKATDQEGVYTKDPKKYADAEKLERLRYEDLTSILAENKHKAGIHQIIDPEAIKILKRARIKIVVVNGFKPENVLLAIKGEHVGTIIE